MSGHQPIPSTRGLRKHRIACVAVLFVVGSAVGTAAYTFHYAEGLSYMGNDSLACANCHVMQRHYDAWIKSSHHAVAQCNDCHSDPTSFASKMYCKAVNGLAHSWAFTTGWFHEPIQMTDWNREMTEKSCRKCHADMVHEIDLPALSAQGDEMSCTRCHADVGHPWK